jgi:hypothetical protein
MTFLDKLERTLGKYAVANVALYVVIGQVFVLLAVMMGRLDMGLLVLLPQLVLQGEWWRVFSFLLIPPAPGMFGYLLVAFAWYIFYIMSGALESEWGAFRFNVFLLVGWLLTAGTAFFLPYSVASNAFIAGSVFLAFAYLNPNFELLLFFILPLKIKWLAMITWFFYAFSFVTGSGATRLQILASVGNFFLFFTSDIIRGLRQRKRAVQREAQREQEKSTPRHKCHVCGKTNLSDPEMDFRYCSKCAGDECYCTEHIRNHEHVATTSEEKA